MDTQSQSFFSRLSVWIRNSITLRLFTIGILVLLLLIPVSMVEDLIRERENRQDEALTEVSSKWGQQQTLCGIILTVPYTSWTQVADPNNQGKVQLVKTRSYAHFLPDELNIEGNVKPEKRNRGIYEVVVYNADIHLKGKFKAPDFSEWKIAPENINWEDAFLSLGISDLRSIQENVTVKWNGTDYSFNPGAESNDVITMGMSTRIPVKPENIQDANFSMDLNFNGSSNLQFIPLGKTTRVNLSSNWTNPSFSGAFLPDSRVVADSGFKAVWKVLHLNRPFPQKFCGTVTGIQESSFGVDLIMPVDQYQKSMRSAKYAALFITLTFLVFFFAQVLNKVRIHPFQYIVVGLALIVFYTLLIAISEHIAFGWSYLISSVSIISLITFYARSIFKNGMLTRLTAAILVILYGFIYTIIQLQDYALLMGSIGLFIVLASIMIFTRKIDWYGLGDKSEINPE